MGQDRRLILLGLFWCPKSRFPPPQSPRRPLETSSFLGPSLLSFQPPPPQIFFFLLFHIAIDVLISLLIAPPFVKPVLLPPCPTIMIASPVCAPDSYPPLRGHLRVVCPRPASLDLSISAENCHLAFCSSFLRCSISLHLLKPPPPA